MLGKYRDEIASRRAGRKIQFARKNGLQTVEAANFCIQRTKQFAGGNWLPRAWLKESPYRGAWLPSATVAAT